jgi:Mannosylglycerate hydrolase MGH1-like glycoside hydrolase domain
MILRSIRANGRLIRIAAAIATMASLLLVTVPSPASSQQFGHAPHLAATPASVPLTVQSLGMSRKRMAFGGTMLRIFNGRGAVSIRDKSVTGLQNLQFPPIDIPDYRFSLAFQDEQAGTLIQDTVPDVFEHLLRTGKGPNPLGLNFSPGTPYVLLWQQAYWQPNALFRTGTFDKQLHGHWISFGISTKANVSATRDQVYLEVKIKNREPGPLLLTVIPNQQASGLGLSIPNVKSQPAGPVMRPDAFTLASKQVRITVVSDLQEHTTSGWEWKIPGNTTRTAHFGIIVQQTQTPAPKIFAPDISQDMAGADQAWNARLKWAGENIPQLSSDDAALNDFYARCILSVLEARWERDDFFVKPFYAVGTWTYSVAWDTSFASELLSMLDPQGLRETLIAYIRAGLLKSSYIPWNGKAGDYWYVQTPFAVMRSFQEYLRQTGDRSILNQSVGDRTVLDRMKRVGQEMEERFARPDGLLDFGPGTQRFLEIRTDGYQHAVAADNGMAAEYFRQIAEWCRERHDPEAAQFEKWSDRIQESMAKDLWDNHHGGFVSRYPDGSRHLVWSYHLFDLLDEGVLSSAERQSLITHLKEGEFLGPYGMYSISKTDHAHWDQEDADFGGGGQYAGMPLRIAESLYRLGYGELAWDILARCTRWANHFPYIPQSIFTDFPGNTQVEMPLELSAANGVQAILFGAFGLRPQNNGSLEISPSYHHEMGHATMTGYRYRGHSYSVLMDSRGYSVYRDVNLAARNPYGEPTLFPNE